MTSSKKPITIVAGRKYVLLDGQIGTAELFHVGRRPGADKLENVYRICQISYWGDGTPVRDGALNIHYEVAAEKTATERFPLGSTWLTSEGHEVYIAGHIPTRDLLRGVSFTADEKNQDAFGFWGATTGTAFDITATDIGHLVSRIDKPFDATSTAHIDRGDGALDYSDLDAKHGRVSMRKIYTDGAGMAEVEKLLNGLGIQVIKVNVADVRSASFSDTAASISTALAADSDPDADRLASETLSALGWVFNGQAWEEPEPGELANMAGWPAPVEGYAVLQAALGAAYDQSARGKGKERHATAGTAFENQPLISINEMLGSVDGALYQVMKKTQESSRLPVERARAELLGAMVYAAAAWHMLGEKQIQQNLDQF